MYGANLERPAPVYGDPGMDQQAMTLGEHVDGILMLAGKDGMLDQMEQREIQRLMVGLQAIAMQKTGAMQAPGGMPPSETSDFGAMEGTEPAGNSMPPEGQQYAQGGY